MRRPDFAASDAAAGAARPRRPRRRVAIGLTPLIDVVFILLVFFMLASSFLDWRTVRVDAAGSAAGASIEGALLVEVSSGGWRLAGRPIAVEDLRARIEARLAENPAQRVLVRPAPGTPLQRTVDALDLLAGLGVRDVGLSAPAGAAKG